MNTDQLQKQYVFGPVLSKRLGLSLGIDLLGAKICSFNCVYCEVEKTQNLTIQRKAYVPAQLVIEQLDSFFSQHQNLSLNFITFSGKGEPTLNCEIALVISHIKKHYPYKICVLTNSSLLDQKQVRQDIMNVDLIIPSLDALSQKAFKKVNLPERSIRIPAILKGIKQLRNEFHGQFWLEILFVEGINNSHEEIEYLKKEVQEIMPDKVCINTIYRPPAFQKFKPISQEQIKALEKEFNDCIQRNPKKQKRAFFSPEEKDPLWNKKNVVVQLKAMLAVRPCTLEDLQKIFCSHQDSLLSMAKLKSILESLVEKKVLTIQPFNQSNFYALKK